MIKLNGKGVSNGIAFGKLSFIKRDEICVKRKRVDNTSLEMKRFRIAKDFTLSQLDKLYEKALVEVGEANAQIFEIHKMMLDDEDFNESIENFIVSQNLNAEYSVALTADNFSEMFSSMDDDYMRGRAADVKDVSERLIKNLMNKSTDSNVDEKSIICADDLAPSETVQLDKSKVLAFCTAQGSLNSHTAILARTMNTPAIIGLGNALSEEYDGKLAMIDGQTGIIYIEPDEETILMMTQKRDEEIHKRELLQLLKGKENITLDGHKINVYANIGGLGDLGAVLANDAGGIGLFRSEFLYLESENYPDEDTQFQCYKKVLERMAGRKVTSEHWISVQISKLIILSSIRKIILQWDLGQSESVLIAQRFSKHSSGRCIVLLYLVIWALCSR